ncbi:MAG: radical SAM protein [Bacteroidales bacterium]|nr:radical SAM protein [Bacteroidales bacterium]
MEYQPYAAVWEITFACNMRCKHCGSSCNTTKPDELTTEEGLKLCDQIGELKLHHITLSGGEPLMRKDWHILAKRIRENGVTPNMITNGWLLTEDDVRKAKDAGISNIAISLDGVKETHDFMRMQGSYDRIMSALQLLKKGGVPSSTITTVNKKNLHELPKIYEILKANGVGNWQLQYAMPMGNLLQNNDLVIDPEEIEVMLDYLLEFSQENIIRIDLADCVGYYNEKELEIKSQRIGKPEDYFWTGCLAGKNILGIRYNGDVVGCSSLRDDEFIEDNVRNRSLLEIWNDPKSFAWNRELKKKDLTGFCATCQYGNYCLAGCSVLKFTMGKKLKENRYCTYRVAAESDYNEVRKIKDNKKLMELSAEAISDENYQFADACLNSLHEQDTKNISILNQLGFVNYKLENYEKSLKFNDEVLSLDPKNAYAHKGKGICLSSMGETQEGISYLEKSIELADENFLDPYFDLSLVYYNCKDYKKAKEVLMEGRKKSEEFKNSSDELYQLIEEELGNS